MVFQVVELGIGRLIGQAAFLAREWLELIAGRLFAQLKLDGQTVELGCSRFLGDAAARCGEKTIICDYAGLIRMALR